MVVNYLQWSTNHCISKNAVLLLHEIVTLHLVILNFILLDLTHDVKLQWNLSITDTLGPDIFGHFLLQYRGFPLSEVKNVLVAPFETKIFVLIMEIFSIESLIRRVC